MKISKTIKHFAFVLTLFVVALTLSLAVAVTANDDGSVEIEIEGIDECVFYGTYTPSVYPIKASDLLAAFDAQNDSITFVSDTAGYISSVNGTTAGKFGGWDGWLVMINGVSPSVGLSSCDIVAGDSILLYYGDAFGVGMQIPYVDDKDLLSDGILRFLSDDTIYDAAFNPTSLTRPVVGATVCFDGTAFVTDENGEIKVPAASLSVGKHSLTIEKKTAAGLPLILRFPPDYTLEIEASPLTGDNNVLILSLACVISALLSVTFATGFKRSRENSI